MKIEHLVVVPLAKYSARPSPERAVEPASIAVGALGLPQAFQVPPVAARKVAGAGARRLKNMARVIPRPIALQETRHTLEAASFAPVLLTATVAFAVAGVVAAVATLATVIARSATAAPVIAGSPIPA